MDSADLPEESREDLEADLSREESSMFVEQEFEEGIPESDQEQHEQEGDEENQTDQDHKMNDEINNDSNSYSDSDSGSQSKTHEAAAEAADPCETCFRSLQRVRTLKRHLTSKDHCIHRKSIEIISLKKTVNELKAQVKRLLGGGNKTKHKRKGIDTQPQRTWHSLLREVVNGGKQMSYTDVWRQSNMEENISVNLKYIHPNLRFVAPDSYEPRSQIEWRPTGAAHLSKFERFNDLPTSIQLRIFAFVLRMDRCLIHVFSRLDPLHIEPQHPRTESGLPHKFFISDVANGKADISLSNATDPAELLQPLLTCKRWCFYLCHIFYGANTFSFSSFGEFEKFCNGIGPARVQRIQNLELYWRGGVHNTPFQDDSRWISKHRNLHVFPLIWLREALRLRTMVIWVSETAKRVIRRRWEPKDHGKWEVIRAVTMNC